MLIASAPDGLVAVYGEVRNGQAADRVNNESRIPVLKRISHSASPWGQFFDHPVEVRLEQPVLDKAVFLKLASGVVLGQLGGHVARRPEGFRGRLVR